MLQLASFIQDWWFSIQKFFHEMDIVLKCLIVGTLLMIALLGLVKLLKEKEVFDLLSYVRLGSEISLLDLNTRELDRILIEIKNSIIQTNYEKQLSDTELDLVRASIVKQVL